MLIYCYRPLGVSYEAAAPAFRHAIDNELVRQILLRGVPDQLAGQPGEIDGALNSGAVTIGVPTGTDGRVGIPFWYSTEDSALMSMVGEVTLSRLGVGLCHLSMSGSITGVLATGLMYHRGFQMSVELAAAEFLDKLSRSVIMRAGTGRRTRSA